MGPTSQLLREELSAPQVSTLLVGGTPRPNSAHALAVESLQGQRSNGGQFREVVLQQPLENLDNVWAELRTLTHWIQQDGILTVSYAESRQSSLRQRDVDNLLALCGFQVLRDEAFRGGRRVRARPLGRMREAVTPGSERFSCTVVVPCKNEVHNVAEVVRRVPQLGKATELIFVDGASTDGTAERIEQLIEHHPDRDIRLMRQASSQAVGCRTGKAGAVFAGFDAASGDVLMILDADMTVAPEDLPRFYFALAEGLTEFANGNRFAFPMQSGAMMPLNFLGNRLFGVFFSWLLNRNVGDTLCGTKAFLRTDWPRIRRAAGLFGRRDPWGDFDLLLAASLTGLRIRDVPVRYFARTAGESKMRPFRHGLALARTCAWGVLRLKLGATQARGRAV